jgi:hypothetical protein
MDVTRAFQILHEAKWETLKKAQLHHLLQSHEEFSDIERASTLNATQANVHRFIKTIEQYSPHKMHPPLDGSTHADAEDADGPRTLTFAPPDDKVPLLLHEDTGPHAVPSNLSADTRCRALGLGCGRMEYHTANHGRHRHAPLGQAFD